MSDHFNVHEVLGVDHQHTVRQRNQIPMRGAGIQHFEDTGQLLHEIRVNNRLQHIVERVHFVSSNGKL